MDQPDSSLQAGLTAKVQSDLMGRRCSLIDLKGHCDMIIPKCHKVLQDLKRQCGLVAHRFKGLFDTMGLNLDQ
uniref:Uncharacterized protein n=1 Tax=Anguilla anguilla TaxID=7936 RepID=A0A0E9WAL8_ANGAN